MENKDEKTEIILAQWQTCVEMANSISQRRDTMNNIFITLNLAILASISIMWEVKSIFVLIAGIIISLLILKVAIGIFIDSVNKVTDKAVDSETEQEIRKVITETEGVIKIDRLRTRQFGNMI